MTRTHWQEVLHWRTDTQTEALLSPMTALYLGCVYLGVCYPRTCIGNWCVVCVRVYTNRNTICPERCVGYLHPVHTKHISMHIVCITCITCITYIDAYNFTYITYMNAHTPAYAQGGKRTLTLTKEGGWGMGENGKTNPSKLNVAVVRQTTQTTQTTPTTRSTLSAPLPISPIEGSPITVVDWPITATYRGGIENRCRVYVGEGGTDERRPTDRMDGSESTTFSSLLVASTKS